MGLSGGRQPNKSVTCYLRLILTFFITFAVILICNSAPVQAQSIGPDNLPAADLGIPYSIQLLTVDMPGSPTYKWTIISGSLPHGLFLDPSSGLLHGIPDMAGNYTFVVQVDGSAGALAQQAFLISVSATPITFFTSSLPDAIEGSDYNMQITVNGGTPPYTWTIAGGSLPEGLMLEEKNGIISGTPVEGSCGSFNFSIKVTDSNKLPIYAQQSFNLMVNNGYYEAVVTIDSSLLAGEATVVIDGKETFKLPGSASKRFIFPIGTKHSVSVDDLVPHPTESGVRFKPDREIIVVNEFMSDAVFNYETYYQLAAISNHGDIKGNGWYQAFSVAKWKVAPDAIPMSGILGFFKGTFKPEKLGEIEIMDTPKTIAISWQPDYTLPIIFISLIALAVSGIGFVVYRRLRTSQPRLAVQPVYQQRMREEVLEEFFWLLKKYEGEIGTIGQIEELSELPVITEISGELMEGDKRMIFPGIYVDKTYWTHKAKELLHSVKIGKVNKYSRR